MPAPAPTIALSTAPPGEQEPLDVIVIGAGQAALALGYHLAGRGVNFVILDAGPEIGHS